MAKKETKKDSKPEKISDCSVLEKRFKPITVGPLKIVVLNDIGLEDCLVLLGYPEDYFAEEGSFKKASIPTLIKEAPRNTGNRPFGAAHAKNLLVSMGQDAWELNGESTIFDENGQCNSGQHRIAAKLMLLQMQAKKKIPEALNLKMTVKGKAPETPILVVMNTPVSKHSADTIDTGRSRSHSDVLFRSRRFGRKFSTSEQDKLARMLSVAARLVWLRVQGISVRGGPKFIQGQMVKFLDRHPGIKDAVLFVHSQDEATSGGINSLVSLGYMAGMTYLLSGVNSDPNSGTMVLDNEEEANDFVSKFATGANLKDGDPVLALRNFFSQQKKAGKTRDRDDIVNAIVKAMNAAREGRTDMKWTELKTKENESPARLGGLDLTDEERQELEGGEATDDTQEDQTESSGDDSGDDDGDSEE